MTCATKGSAMTRTGGHAFEVRLDSPLEMGRVVPDPVSEPGAGQVLLVVERFGLSANNVSYATLGNAYGLNYWKPFPAGEGWGRVPAWGLARVVAADAAVAQPGDRFVGFVPMAEHMVLQARATPGGLEDVSPQRAEMLPIYRTMRRVSSDPTWREDLLDVNLLLRPAYPPAALLDDELGSAGAASVVLTSATSKTALMTGRLLTLRGVRTVGLTSDSHREAAEATGAYETVLGYDEISRLPPGPTVLLDVAGHPPTTQQVHARLGKDLVRSLVIGGTRAQDTAADTSSSAPAAPPQELYNTGAREAELAEILGQHHVQVLEDKARDTLIPWAASWMSIDTVRGLGALERVWLQLGQGSLTRSPLRGTTVVPST